MKRPWQQDFDSFIHSVPTWGKLVQKEQYHNFHCSLLTCMLDACDRASHWRHQCDQDTLSSQNVCSMLGDRKISHQVVWSKASVDVQSAGDTTEGHRI